MGEGEIAAGDQVSRAGNFRWLMLISFLGGSGTEMPRYAVFICLWSCIRYEFPKWA